MHKLIWQHFMNDFEPVEFQGLPEDYQLLHRKSEDKEVNKTRWQ
jgi:hypothetical protein